MFLEQLVNTLPQDVRVWVKERKPKTSTEAGQLAEDYIQVRKQNTEGASSQANKKFPDSPTQCWFCQRCGKPGHEARDCRIMVKQVEGKEDTGKKLEKPKRDLKDICYQKEQYPSNCLHCAVFCLERRSHRPIQGDETPPCGEARGC